MNRILKLLLKTVLVALAIGVTVLLVRAFDARRMPDLEVWHRVALESEYRARQEQLEFSFGDYQALEERLYEELEEKIYGEIESSAELDLSRYSPDGTNNPQRFPRNWNRSFELVPPAVRGGALLLHGVSDSPYSLRRVGEILADEGFYVLALRLPGHGTIPAALTRVTWEDWMAVARIGARQTLQRVGGKGPFFIVGYSTGGALAVKYALDTIENGESTTPDRLILFSPAIGVTRLAALSGWHRALSFIPYFEKLRWFSIEPEFDPFKYNSFPMNAGHQVHRMTRMLQKQLAHGESAGHLSSLPPILTFKSLVDSTVLTEAVLDHLYSRLDDGESELVIFDVNRIAQIKVFYTQEPERLTRRLEGNEALPYRLTLITNADDRSMAVVEKSRAPRKGVIERVDLGLEWPPQVYSLSHVAIPFPPDDWTYGVRRGGPAGYGLQLGALEPRGEMQLLRVPASSFLRLRHNPFFDYVESRLRNLAAGAID